jgi:superfamily II DNA or RNA helicase
MTLRPHQQAVVNVCRDILNGAKIKDIVICATPGSGKSFLPVILADNLLPIFADKLCWVVPRNSLKYQGEEEFTTPRWGTTKRLRAAMNGEDLSRGLDGYVTTYQSIGADPLCHSREFSKYRYILVLDEFHHIMNGSEWHKALTSLVEKAALVVKMSGTPARGDGERIAFYNPQKPGYMIRYSRSEAIRDGAILPIHFQLVDGEAEWKETDGRQGASALSGEESAKALFTALRT